MSPSLTRDTVLITRPRSLATNMVVVGNKWNGVTRIRCGLDSTSPARKYARYTSRNAASRSVIDVAILNTTLRSVGADGFEATRTVAMTNALYTVRGAPLPTYKLWRKG